MHKVNPAAFSPFFLSRGKFEILHDVFQNRFMDDGVRTDIYKIQEKTQTSEVVYLSSPNNFVYSAIKLGTFIRLFQAPKNLPNIIQSGFLDVSNHAFKIFHNYKSIFCSL